MKIYIDVNRENKKYVSEIMSALQKAGHQVFLSSDYPSSTDGKIILNADYIFPSPSAAAAMIIGGSANGWTRWKDAEGKTLDEVYRKK